MSEQKLNEQEERQERFRYADLLHPAIQVLFNLRLDTTKSFSTE